MREHCFLPQYCTELPVNANAVLVIAKARQGIMIASATAVHRNKELVFGNLLGCLARRGCTALGHGLKEGPHLAGRSAGRNCFYLRVRASEQIFHLFLGQRRLQKPFERRTDLVAPVQGVVNG